MTNRVPVWDAGAAGASLGSALIQVGVPLMFGDSEAAHVGGRWRTWTLEKPIRHAQAQGVRFATGAEIAEYTGAQGHAETEEHP